MTFDLERELTVLAEAVGKKAFHTICKIAANGFPQKEMLTSPEWASDGIDRELTSNESKVAAWLALLIEDEAREVGRQIAKAEKKYAVSQREDQLLMPGWKAHCKRVFESGVQIKNINSFLDVAGYDPNITKISAKTLKVWAKEAIPHLQFKRGR